MNEKARKRIEAFKRNPDSKLDLSYCEIRALYELIPEIEKLEISSLRLDDNPGIELEGIARLSQLTQLNLSDNQISELSPLESLKQLTQLYLSYNQISDLSPLENLSQLTQLYLINNQISDLSPLESLKQLTQLYLSDNQISELSPLESLKQLIQLNLSDNQISELSPLESLKQLTQLNLWDNRISDLSSLESLKQLTQLNLSYNQISDLSPLESLKQLTQLDLSYNRIYQIELAFLNQFPDLEKLYLHVNPIQNVDSHILGSEYENCLLDLRNYLEDLEQGKMLNNEAKVLLVGNGGVGKTQIARRLVEEDKFLFDQEHNSTHSIVLLPKRIPCDFVPQAELQLHLWDFAGQDLYHASHRLFMQTQAIFLLVWDLKSENDPTHTFQEKDYKNEKLSYWLEYILHFGQGSPILVVQNKVDKAKQANLPKPAQQQWKEAYPIKKFLRVSAKTGVGFTVLGKALTDMYKEDEDLKAALLKPLPKFWAEIRTQIRGEAAKGTKSLSLEKFDSYFDENLKKSRDTVLRFFHNTGLYFYKAGYFQDQIILDQAWAIEALYKVLDRESDYFEILADQQGKLYYEDLCNIWKEHTNEERELFMRFMLSCELCFEITPDKEYNPSFSQRSFVIPQFLSPKPEYIESYILERNLQIEVLSEPYRFLPDLYIQRFIVKAHKFARVGDFWDKGILLHYPKEGSFAIVEADYGQKIIKIRHTANCRDLLLAIQRELEQIKGEGKIRPQKADESWGDIAFAERYIQGFASLQQAGSSHKYFIESLLRKGKLKEAIEELSQGTAFNGQNELHEALVSLSARWHRLEEHQVQRTMSPDNLDIAFNQLIVDVQDCLKSYREAPNYPSK